MAIAALLLGGLAVATIGMQGGGRMTPAAQITGMISNADYPAAAIREGAQGSVGFDLAISATGTVTRCSITHSSGNAALDATTCALATRRFRFRPATRNGRPVASTLSRRVRWTLPD